MIYVKIGDKMKHIIYISFLLVAFSFPILATDFTFADFIGTWQGTSTSESVQEWNTPMTLIVQSNGFYTDSSGLLMPTIYANSQNCEFDSATNRVHFWYLSTVYVNQYFYQHFYYELVSYDGYNLVMEYNFWDDPESHPQVQTIDLTRSGNVQVEDNSILSPAVLKLEGTYPNPFISSTNIRFELKSPANVTLEIYNLLGQKVRTLIQNKLKADNYNVVWNAQNERGKIVPSGIYFYKIKAGTYSSSGKMILQK